VRVRPDQNVLVVAQRALARLIPPREHSIRVLEDNREVQEIVRPNRPLVFDVKQKCSPIGSFASRFRR